MGQFNWTPPKDAVPASQKAAWTPPTDAIPDGAKKVSGSGGASTSLPLSTGGIPDPSSLQNSPPAMYPLTDKGRQDMAQRDEQIRQQQAVQADAMDKQLRKVKDALDSSLQPQFEQAAKIAATRSPDRLTAPTAEELKHTKFMDEHPVMGALTYLGSKTTKGALQIAKGVAHYGSMANNPAMVAAGIDPNEAAFDKLDKLSDFGLTKTDFNNVESGKGMLKHGLSAAGMAAEFAPSVLGGEALQSPKALLFLQGVGQGTEAAKQIESSGQKLKPLAKEALIQGSGAVNLLLSDLGESMFGKLPSGLKQNISTGIAADAIKEAAGKDLTIDGFKKLVQDKTADFATKFQQYGLKALDNYKNNIETFTKLNVGNFALHKAVDALNDKPVFNETPGDLATNEMKTITQDAPIFTIPGMARDLTKLTPYSGYKNEVVDAVIKDPSQVGQVKELLNNHASEQGWTQEETDATLAHVDKIAQAAKAIPATFKPEKRAEAVGLVLDRNELQSKLDKVKADKGETDASLHNIVSPQEQYLTDKIEQANDKLRSMVTGERATYSKVEGEDGKETKYFKTTDGKKESIDRSRYELETLERDVKKQPEEVPAESPAPEQESANQLRTEEDVQGQQSLINEKIKNIPLHNFTITEVVNRDYEKIKKDLGQNGAIKYFQQADRLLNPNENNIVQYRKNGIVTKEGDRYVFHAFGDMDMKNWRIAFKSDVTDQFSKPENDIPTEKAQNEPTPTETTPIPESPPAPKQEASVSSPSENITSTKNAKIDEDRAKRGLSPIMSETAKDFPAVWDGAMKRLEDNPDAGRDLVAELEKKPRAVTDEENALIAHTLVEAKNKYDKANEAVVKAQNAGEDTAPHEAKLEAASAELHRVEETARRVGTETGRGLNSRKMMIRDDMSLASLETKKRVALGRKLTPEERDSLRKVHEEYAEKEKAYEKTIAGLTQRNRDLEERDAMRKLQVEAKQEAKAKTRTARKTDRDQLVKDIRAKLKIARTTEKLNISLPFAQQVAELYKISPELAKLAKSYIAEGVDKLDDLVDKIHNDLKDAFDDLDKRAVRDALSGYGREPDRETKPELQRKLEQLKQEAKLISKLEDLEAKEYTAPERKKAAISVEVEALRKQIAELTQPETSLKSLKTRTANSIKEYERRIAEKDYSTKPPRKPIDLDPEAIKAKADLERVRAKFELDVERDKLANRSTGAKVVDKILKYRRGILLTSIPTIGKISTAAMYRILGTPLHELTGSFLRRIPGISRIASKSPREGAGFRTSAEKQAFSSIWDKNTWEQAGNKLRGKLDDLDLLYGGKKEHATTGHWIWGIFGNIHGSIKEFAKYNEFERSVKLRTEFAEKSGLNIEDPMVQLQIGMNAYKDANRSIFMNDNLANKGYRMLTNFLESKSVENSDFGKSGKIASSVLKFMLPIVKVPTNYLIEKTQYIPIAGAAKLGLTLMRNGIKELDATQADYVMRVIKKQGIGTGLLAIGYFNPQAFGGLYTPGEKKDKYGLKANDVEVLGIHLPHWMTHTPLLSILQLGATIRRATDANGVSTGLAKSALAQGGDIAESTPFYTAPKEAAKVFQGTEQASAYAGDMLRSLIVPPDVKTLAEKFDTDANGNPVKRHPESVLQGIEQGIPGLRQNVPIKSTHAGYGNIEVNDTKYKLSNDQIQEREKFYDYFLKTEGAKRLQEAISKAKTEKLKADMQERLTKAANKYSKLSIMKKYHDTRTGKYNFEKVE